MSKIKIGQTPEGKTIQLNLEVLAETHMFINATSGGGKSSLMRVIAERFHLSPDEVLQDIRTSGISILARDCNLAIWNPMKWMG